MKLLQKRWWWMVMFTQMLKQKCWKSKKIKVQIHMWWRWNYNLTVSITEGITASERWWCWCLHKWSNNCVGRLNWRDKSSNLYVLINVGRLELMVRITGIWRLKGHPNFDSIFRKKSARYEIKVNSKIKIRLWRPFPGVSCPKVWVSSCGTIAICKVHFRKWEVKRALQKFR